MTVVKFIDPDEFIPLMKSGYEVTWFDQRGTLQTAVFDEELIELFVDDDED